jgi:DNA-binding NarL/FixJ family response regulator
MHLDYVKKGVVNLGKKRSIESRSTGGPCSVVMAVLGKGLAESCLQTIRAEPSLRLAGNVSGYAGIIQHTERVRPDVLILDMQYLRDDGPELIGHLHGRAADTDVLLVGKMQPAEEMAVLVRHGVAGIVSRSSTPGVLLRAIKGICAGEMWLPRATMSEILRTNLTALETDELAETLPIDALTGREREVACCIRQGFSNKQIARELEITENTVRAHVANIFKKLHVRRRVDLIVRASENIPR